MRALNRLQSYVRSNRRNPTKHEGLLYSALLVALRPYHVVLVAQEIVGPYIADFCIYPCRLVIEVDGFSHRSQREYDARRDTFMRNLGIRVLRFTNREVENDAADVAARVVAQCGDMEFATGKPDPVTIPAYIRRDWRDREVEKHNIYENEFVRQKNGFRRRHTSSLSSLSGIAVASPR